MRGLTQRYARGQDHRKSFRISIWLSAITTIIGIGVLLFAQHPALKSIALLAVIGISSVLFLTFFLEEGLYHLFIQGRKDRGQVPFTLVSFLLSVIAFVIFVSGCFLLMGIRLLFFMPLFPKRQKLIYHYLVMWYCRFLLYIMMNMRKKVVDKKNIDFSKPSVIISNHHSFLDILMMLMFHPKVVMVTNDWVYNSPFFGMVVRYADFIRVSAGIETQLDKIRKLVEQGYSIIVFPEGQRSEHIELSRFHKGAFYLAEVLQLDIQAVVLHGTHRAMPKKDGFYLRSGCLYARFLQRIAVDDPGFGLGYKERTKQISKYFRVEYQKTRVAMETPSYHYETLYKNYLYKSPVLEWYFRVKMWLEGHYQLFLEILPANGRIFDIGCGYGFLSFSLALNRETTWVTGLDYDANKIEIADNCPVKPANLRFIHADAATFDYPPATAYILSDVLHYLTREEQHGLMVRLIATLEPGGLLLVRDGDKEKRKSTEAHSLPSFFRPMPDLTKPGISSTLSLPPGCSK
ncbi:MAG: methyltransferase domain-containing protein [Cyclobacteriaceae bacterium]|nr:methyltransferase domain-containing protein [Cyclobacteriaceae bacterium]